MNNFNFDPVKGFQDSASFPNPTNENEVREQLTRLHNQTKDFINEEIVKALNTLLLNEITSITSSDGSIVVTKSGKTISLKVSPSGSQGASQAYVDEQDRITLQSAKDYCDTKDTIIDNKITQVNDKVIEVRESLGTQVTYSFVGGVLEITTK